MAGITGIVTVWDAQAAIVVQDTQSIVTLEYNSKNRIFRDTVEDFTEVLSLQLGIPFSTSITPSESIGIANAKVFADAVSVSDAQVVSQGFGRSFLDNVVFDDETHLPTGNDGLINSGTINEWYINYHSYTGKTATFAVNTGPSDGITVTEDITFTYGVFRRIDDTQAVDDAIGITFTTAFADSFSVSDALALNFHDYNEMVMDVTPSDDMVISFYPAATIDGNPLNSQTLNG